MNEEAERKDHLVRQITETHAHFSELMAERLLEVGTHELEIYLSVLGKLVDKLETREMTMRETAQDMFAEVVPIVIAELAL